MKRFVRGLNQPMTARLIKTARSLKIPQEIGLILCSVSASAPLATSEAWRDDFIGQTLSHDVSHANCQRADRRLSRVQRFRLGSLGFVRSMKDDFIGQTLSHDVTREKLPGWNKWRADRGLGCGENGTICLHSNVIRIGEKDTTKRKKVTITSSKKEKNKQNKQKKSSGPSCQPTSRWVPQ